LAKVKGVAIVVMLPRAADVLNAMESRTI